MDEGRFSVSAQFRVAPLFCRPWTLNGISPRLIESHYEHNYGAALTRLNAVTRELEGIDFGIATPQAIGRLKREQSTCSTRPCCTNSISRALAVTGERFPR